MDEHNSTTQSTHQQGQRGAVMVSNIPPSLNLSLYRGDAFETELAFTQDGEPYALPATGWLAQIRRHNNTGDPLATFAINATRATDGIITISLDAATTKQLTYSLWDLQCGTRTYLRGTVSITEDITHD